MVGNIYADVISLNILLSIPVLVVLLIITIIIISALMLMKTPKVTTNGNNYSEGSGYNSNYTWQNTLQYGQQFGKHNVKVLVGSEAITSFGRSEVGSRGGYILMDPNFLSLKQVWPVLRKTLPVFTLTHWNRFLQELSMHSTTNTCYKAT